MSNRASCRCSTSTKSKHCSTESCSCYSAGKGCGANCGCKKLTTDGKDPPPCQNNTHLTVPDKPTGSKRKSPPSSYSRVRISRSGATATVKSARSLVQLSSESDTDDDTEADDTATNKSAKYGLRSSGQPVIEPLPSSIEFAISLLNNETQIKTERRNRTIFSRDRMIVIPNSGEGDCLFRAFSQALFSREREHLHLRAALMEFFRSARCISQLNKTDIIGLINSDREDRNEDPVDGDDISDAEMAAFLVDYADKHEMIGRYMDATVPMHSLSLIFNRRVMLWHYNDETGILSSSGDWNRSRSNPHYATHILTTGGNHFELMVVEQQSEALIAVIEKQQLTIGALTEEEQAFRNSFQDQSSRIASAVVSNPASSSSGSGDAGDLASNKPSSTGESIPPPINSGNYGHIADIVGAKPDWGRIINGFNLTVDTSNGGGTLRWY